MGHRDTTPDLLGLVEAAPRDLTPGEALARLRLARTDGIAVLWDTHDHDQEAAVADGVLEVTEGTVRVP